MCCSRRRLRQSCAPRAPPPTPGEAWPAAVTIFVAKQTNAGSPPAYYATFDDVTDSKLASLPPSSSACALRPSRALRPYRGRDWCRKRMIMGYRRRGASSAWIFANPRFDQLSTRRSATLLPLCSCI